MPDLTAWVEARRPPAPADLAERVRRSGTEHPADPDRVTALVRMASDRLDAARASRGRVRESAFQLLAADALVTYACEAALEADDPVASLGQILSVGVDR